MRAGRQPSDLALSADGKTLYVANSDEDSVGVFHTGRRQFTGTLALRPEQDPGFGQIPNALALSPDGRTLWWTPLGSYDLASIDTDVLTAPNLDDAMTSNLNRIQNSDGSWSGHHCITGRTFCTSTALLVLMADRSPVPVSATSTTPTPGAAPAK